MEINNDDEEMQYLLAAELGVVTEDDMRAHLKYVAEKYPEEFLQVCKEAGLLKSD